MKIFQVNPSLYILFFLQILFSTFLIDIPILCFKFQAYQSSEFKILGKCNQYQFCHSSICNAKYISYQLGSRCVKFPKDVNTTQSIQANPGNLGILHFPDHLLSHNFIQGCIQFSQTNKKYGRINDQKFLSFHQQKRKFSKNFFEKKQVILLKYNILNLLKSSPFA
ncbi:unnamed protein product [Paramecium octaurelia]|uniref:Transmembrane protein n=1 Tax=Paramecium octaurelia TaxID=43137 RepID=A0A8S1YN37_PAROT|nr:unnamed protein product [Paramecium octaurelia]